MCGTIDAGVQRKQWVSCAAGIHLTACDRSIARRFARGLPRAHARLDDLIDTGVPPIAAHLLLTQKYCAFHNAGGMAQRFQRDIAAFGWNF